jgi:hypothetical protein
MSNDFKLELLISKVNSSYQKDILTANQQIQFSLKLKHRVLKTII